MAVSPNLAVSLVLAQASQPGGSSFVQLLTLWIPILLIFYLLLYVPQQRQRKRTQQMQSALKAGDKVIMTCGIYGTVVGVEDNAVQLRIAEQTKIRVSRQSIAEIQAEPKES
ncbi:MAG TPA: preprotein translocase subunit YajC [Candidatus Acidoferrales bacterium]|nr:preprotein translocase subunit YajC [Candidatus Acidoferrales bacterium]